MIRARESSSMHLNLENFDMEEGKAQYNVFQDYLGLINLICPSNKFSNSYPEGCDVMYTFPTEGIHRHRMDSLDSDALSDSSSSGESREMELMDGSERYSYSSNPSPPLSGILDTPPLSYSQTLESLIIARKTALNRIQPKESRNSKNNSNNKATVCVFCRNNGESREFYSSHTLKDNEGNTACPILRAYTCPLCKANGDNSHTIKYCPKYTPKLKNEKLLGIGIML